MNVNGIVKILGIFRYQPCKYSPVCDGNGKVHPGFHLQLGQIGKKPLSALLHCVRIKNETEKFLIHAGEFCLYYTFNSATIIHSAVTLFEVKH